MKHNFERYCKDYENIENYEKAKKDNFKGWEVHHRLETHTSDGERRTVIITAAELKVLDMYYNRPSSELIFLTTREHSKLCKYTDETRRKMSELKKGEKNPNYGKHLSEGQKNRLSEAHKGKKFSEEHKKKLSEAKKGKYAGEKNPMHGKRHTEETRKKMSRSWDYDKHFSEEAKKKMGAARKGRHWFNNGKESKFCFECPSGFTPGRLRINKNLLEFLDRTGKHVSRKTFEKYKDKKKSFIGWERLIR